MKKKIYVAETINIQSNLNYKNVINKQNFNVY